jgi:hypothetical protein
MPFHIDTDGTRRRYSFQVQQGFGGNSGDDGLVPLTRLPPDIATDAELAASLAAHVDPLTDPHRQYITAAKLAAALAGRRGRTYFISQI